MVYKIRNKGFGAVFSGTANSRAYPARKTQVNPDLSSHITLQVQITRFTGMRILHNYRNISRATKQFMMGDRFFEQLMILTLREHYFRPMYYKAPIENTFFLVSLQSRILKNFSLTTTFSHRAVLSLILPTDTMLCSPTISTHCS